MIIKTLKCGILEAPLITPFKTALRTVEKIRDVIVILETDTGAIGYGEAPPTKAITGETEETLLADLMGPIRKAVVGKDLNDLDRLFAALDTCMEHHTSAKAAVDIAVYDLLGQAEKKPVYQLFGGTRSSIETDLTISVNDPSVMASDARAAIARGFRTLKIKVGINPSLDVERLIAVRQAVGKDIIIRADANQAWNAQQAVDLLQEIQSHAINLELIEQPVKAADLEGLAYVTAHSPVPVVADESCFSPEDARKIYQEHLADMVNIKLMKCGGLHNALKIVQYAKEAGAQCMLGCMLEAKVSVNAAVQLACAEDCITKIDLDGPALCSEDPVIGGSVFAGPVIHACKEPGFGIQELKGLKIINL